jgi:hypothetical protein
MGILMGFQYTAFLEDDPSLAEVVKELHEFFATVLSEVLNRYGAKWT